MVKSGERWSSKSTLVLFIQTVRNQWPTMERSLDKAWWYISITTDNHWIICAEEEPSGDKYSTTWRPSGDYTHLKISFLVQSATIQVTIIGFKLIGVHANYLTNLQLIPNAISFSFILFYCSKQNICNDFTADLSKNRITFEEVDLFI